MFKNDNNVTFQDLNNRIDNLRNWEIKGIEDDIKNLAQLVSMLITELGYSASMVRGQVVTLNKIKKSK